MIDNTTNEAFTEGSSAQTHPEVSELRHEIDRLKQELSEQTAQLEQTLKTVFIQQSLIEGNESLVAAIDLEYNFIAFNTPYRDEISKVIGKEIAPGMNILEAFAHLTQEQKKVREIWARALQGEEFTVIEDFGVDDKERFYYEIRYKLLRDKQGTQIGAAHVSRNITARVRAEAQARELQATLEQRMLDRATELELINQKLEAEIIERKQVEEQRFALLEQVQITEARYRSLFEGLADTILVADDNGNYIDVNPAASTLLGYSREELLQMHVSEISNTSPEQTAKMFEDFVAQSHWRGELELRRKDGTIVPTEGQATLIKLPHTSLFVAVTRDISARKKTEEKLQFLAALSQRLASSLDYETVLQELVLSMVPYLGDYCLFDLVNEENPEIFERVAIFHADPVKAALAREIDYHYPPSKNGPHPLAGVLTGGQSVFISHFTDEILQAQAHDAEHLRLLRAFAPQSLISVPLSVRERIIGVLTCVRAESGRHYQTADLDFIQEVARRTAIAVDNARLYEEAQKALVTQKELDYLKDLFVSVASHELRSPLTAIKGYTQMLQNILNKQFEAIPDGQERRKGQERLLRNLGQIVRQSNRMEELIKQMLDFSRIQNKKLELHYLYDANLIELVKRKVEQYQSITTDHKLVVHNPAQPIIASYDENRLEQVLDNLISNALKYSPAESTVTVGIEAFSGSDRPDQVVIWVQDEGYGISEEEQSHVFNRFHRIRSNDNARVDGLGLGLYISSEIVKQHGGQIWLRSEVGKGSTFYIAIPFTPSSILSSISE